MENALKQNDSTAWLSMINGDIDGLEALFRQYYDDMFYYALKLSGSTERAEDHIHQTFLHIWEHRHSLGDVRSVKAYLLISLRNNVLMEKRKKGAMGNDNIYELPLLAFSPEEIVIEKEEQQEQKKQLLRALSQLPRRQREVLVLKFYNNLTYQEIQDVMQLNYQTVRNYVHQGLNHMRDFVDSSTVTLAVFMSLLPGCF